MVSWQLFMRGQTVRRHCSADSSFFLLGSVVANLIIKLIVFDSSPPLFDPMPHFSNMTISPISSYVIFMDLVLRSRPVSFLLHQTQGALPFRLMSGPRHPELFFDVYFADESQW
jgi:hypothetical protein